MRFLVYMYYTHSCYQTSIFGKNCAYYIRIFTVCNSSDTEMSIPVCYSEGPLFQTYAILTLTRIADLRSSE